MFLSREIIHVGGCLWEMLLVKAQLQEAASRRLVHMRVCKGYSTRRRLIMKLMSLGISCMSCDAMAPHYSEGLVCVFVSCFVCFVPRL